MVEERIFSQKICMKIETEVQHSGQMKLFRLEVGDQEPGMYAHLGLPSTSIGVN